MPSSRVDAHPQPIWCSGVTGQEVVFLCPQVSRFTGFLVGMNLAWWYLVITISAVAAAYTQAFLNTFASLGLNPGQGSRWMLKLLCVLVSTDRVSGPIFVYRVCTPLRQDTPPGCRSCHMQIYLLTSYLVPLQASIQTCVILGLMEGGSCVPSTPPEDIQGIGVNASLLHSYSSR